MTSNVIPAAHSETDVDTRRYAADPSSILETAKWSDDPNDTLGAPFGGATYSELTARNEPLLRFEVSTLPRWVDGFAARLREFIDGGVCSADWNGHGAQPLRREAVTLALRALNAVCGRDERPLPMIYPTFRGGLQLEWHLGGASVEIEVDPNGSVEAFFEDPSVGKDWEGLLTEREDDVRSSLDRLMARTRAR